DIFCHQCTCELCGKSAHYGYNCPSKVPIIPDPEPFNNQTVDQLPQTLPSFDPTCYFEDGNSFTYDSKSNIVDDSPNILNLPLQPLHIHMADEHLDTIMATESNEFIKSSVENLVPIPSESEGIPGNMCDVPFHDNSPPLDVLKDQFEDFSDSNDDSTSIDDDSFSIDDIEYVEAPPPDSELVSLEKTNTFYNSLPEYETFCFDLEEISSGSTTTRSDISLPDYEAFYDDHVKEISSGSTTTHSDFSLYDSFIFDLSINPFPLTGRSDFYEFTDELAHIISPPEYDCFCFKNEPNSGDFTMDVVEDNFPTREPRVHVHNALPTHPNLQLNLDFILSCESLFAYVSIFTTLTDFISIISFTFESNLSNFSESSIGQPSPVSTTSIPTPPPPTPPPPPPPLPIIRQHPANLHQNPRQRVTYNPFVSYAIVLPNSIKPTSFTIANNSLEWRQAMKEEYDALMKNRTWSLVPRASNTNVVDGKWVYRLKQNKNGAITCYKARFVAKGFWQQPVFDFHETFSPVVKSTTIQAVLSLAVTNNRPLRLLDVHNAFLHGNIKERVYMQQPSGFIDPQRSNHVCLLHKSFYGLKQASRAWFECLSKALFDLCFKGSKTDPSLFIYSRRHTLLYILVYVDDIIVTGNPDTSLEAFSNVDWAGDSGDRRSTRKFAIYLGLNFISWTARKQRMVSRSSTEPEYKDIADTVAELTWLQALLHELGIRSSSTPILWCDNLGATYLSANPIFRARTKHVEIHYHFVQEKVAQEDLRV
nr:putative RNA-directed DNA polymerase [Tanacetum cinerariifolium]